MAYELIVDGSATSLPAFAGGDGSQIVLMSRNPAKSGGSDQTVDVWSGSTTAIREMFKDYEGKNLIESIYINQTGAKSNLNITWSTAFVDGEEPDEDDPDVTDNWSWQAIEIPTPLVAHPYFQVAYVEASGEVIEDEIARCESKIKRGQPYIASGAYKDYVKRYYSLRMAGVEEWMQFGIEITKTHTVSDVATVKAMHTDAGKVYLSSAIGAPANIVTAINGMERIESYASADPDSYTMIQSKYEYVKRPPQCDYSGTDDNPSFDITETWVGVAEWSSVIYPNGSWDPQGETE